MYDPSRYQKPYILFQFTPGHSHEDKDYIVSISELLCLIPILVGSSVATVWPPERDTALRTAVTTITRVPL